MSSSDDDDELSDANTSNDEEDAEINLLARHVGSERVGASGQHPSYGRFQTAIKKWDDTRTNAGFDPTDVMEDMADILEKVSLLLLLAPPLPAKISPHSPLCRLRSTTLT